MIELDRHIEILLLSNDCVIVPDLGGFMAHYADARYETLEHMFLPPFRTLGFNPQLKMNDSLLVQSYIEAYDISYPEALRRIQNEVDELRQHLETEGMFELNGIGTLSFNDEGSLEFNPCEAGILTPELYGLSSFQMPPLKAEEEPQKPEVQLEDLESQNATITIKMSWLRNIAAAAAAIVAFLMISSPISNSEMSSTTQQSAFFPISTTQPIKEPTGNADEQLANTPTGEQSSADENMQTSETGEPIQTDDTPQPAPANQTSYCIVMASQVSMRNAESFINHLNKQGFEDARILETSYRRVVYGSFSSFDDATAELRNLRKQSNLFKDSWVMQIK